MTRRRILATVTGAAETTPAYVEQQIRMRDIAKLNIMRAAEEDRLAKACRSRPMKLDLSGLIPKETPVGLFRVPERKDETGCRGPGVCLGIDTSEDGGTAVVKMEDYPYCVPFGTSESICLTVSVVFHY